MNRPLCRGVLLIGVLCLASAVDAPLRAQPGDAAVPPAPDAPRPQAADAGTPADQQPGATEAVTPLDPTVQAVLDFPAETPADVVRILNLLIDLGHAPLAKPYMQRLLEPKLDDATLIQLAERFSTAQFMKIARQKELNPEATQLVEAIISATQRAARDPARLAELAAQLGDPARGARHSAIVRLRSAREYAVAPLLAVLADPKRAQEHPTVIDALVELGPMTIAPLTATLEATDAPLQAHVAEALGRLRARAAVPKLLALAYSPDADPTLRQAVGTALAQVLGGVPDAAAAATMLRTEAREALRHHQTEVDDTNEPVEIWQWDHKQNQVVARSCAPRAAQVWRARRLAQWALELAPANRDTQRLYLAALLEDLSLRSSSGDKPSAETDEATLRDALERFGLPAFVDVLDYCLAEDLPAAATLVVRLLGQTGDAALLYTDGGRPGALVRAIERADRRLALTALDAVLTLDHAGPYAGSSAVPRMLAFWIASTGAKRALVADTRIDEAERVTSLLVELGYDAQSVTDGRELFRLASESPDVELVLLDVTLDHPTAREALFQLRRDARTAAIPVGIVAGIEQWDAAQRLAQGDPRTVAVMRPHTPEALERQVATLLNRDTASREERLRQASAALDWLTKLSAAQRQDYDLAPLAPVVERALHVPVLAEKAAAVLANLPAASSQQSLVALASQAAAPLERRQAAAAAFGQNVRRWGILLSTTDILSQYDHYNRSEPDGKEVQRILASILDDLEAAGRARPPG